MGNRTLSLSLLIALLMVSFAFAGDGSSKEMQKELLALAKAEQKAETGAFLGVVPEEVTSDIAGDYGVGAGQGVLVEETVEGSPADEAGIRSNDILISLNGSRLTGPSELRVQLDKFKEGDQVALAFMRGGKERTVTVTLEGKDREFNWSWGGDTPMPPMPPHMPKILRWETEKEQSMAFAGIVTQELSEGLRSYFKVEGGALISEVVEKSPADKAGLKAGDVITRIGTEAVADQGDVSSVIRDLDPDQTVDFHIIRDGQPMVIPVTLTKRKEFYGDVPGSDTWAFSFDDKDAEELAKQMEKLNAEIESMGIELEAMPDMELDLRIDGADPKVFVGSGEARAITDNHGWWNWSFKDLRAQIKDGVQALKKDLETLKKELKQLQSEIRDRMSGLWTQGIDLAPQA